VGPRKQAWDGVQMCIPLKLEKPASNGQIRMPRRKGKPKIAPVHTTKAFRGSRSIPPLIHDLDGRWM
jgi:hypothetical protein